MGYKNTDRCLAKVAVDEPIFVLRAADVLAPATIRFWLTEANKTLAFNKYQEALNCIAAMEQWQADNPTKAKRPD